ncbi:hypothetical protein E2C01_030004 [Portunus trituberculatus]|uniref:Uncharacterized protein n=1 Tax=Portunus trituberculatus TaxID=210409 RepID=A0A5B7EPB8_PORTR|nr:hypothetical protein [Portunus trituberculatus]
MRPTVAPEPEANQTLLFRRKTCNASEVKGHASGNLTHAPAAALGHGATRGTLTHLFGKDGDVLVEGFGGADVPASHTGLPRRACGELTLLEDQRQQGKQRVPAGGTQHEDNSTLRG